MKKIYLLLLISLVFIACQKEEMFQEQQDIFTEEHLFSIPDLTIDKVYNFNLDQNVILQKELEKWTNRKERNSKTQVFIEKYDLTVDTHSAIFISHNDYHSYTFRVEDHKSTDPQEFKNLVFSFKEGNKYKAILVTYNFSEEEVEKIRNNEFVSVSNSNKSSWIELDLDHKSFLKTGAEEDLGNGIFKEGGNCYKKIYVVSRGTGWIDEIKKPVDCPKEKVTYIEEGGGGGTGTGTGTGTGSETGTTTDPYAPTGGGGGGTGTGTETGSTGTNTGSTGTGEEPGVGETVPVEETDKFEGDLTSPLIPYPVSEKNVFESTLSIEQNNWINNNLIQYDKEIISFLEGNNYAEEAKVEASMKINLKIAEPKWNMSDTGFYNSLKYKGTYKVSSLEKMYLLENGLVLYAANGEKIINKKAPLSLASTEANSDGYHYIYSYNTKRYYEYRVPKPDYPNTDLDFLFDGFWDGVKIFGRYATPLEDAIILIDGKDFDGELANQYKAGGLLFASLVPGGKILKPVAKVAKGTTAWKFTTKYSDKAVTLSFRIINGVVDFGSRTKLASVIKATSLEEAHHIIPWTKFKANQVIQEAAYSGFHMNSKVNGRALQKYTALTGDGLHGNHPAYDDVVQELIRRFEDVNQNIDADIAKNFLEKNLIPRLNSYINEASTSGLNLNSFFKDVIKPRLNMTN